MAGNLFAEYIGALWNGVRLSDVPINPRVVFHFILAFSIDYTTTDHPTPTNGHFNVFWDDGLITPAAVASIKQKHPNVKFALSLGGDTVNNINVDFKADDVDAWVGNAVSSLTTIIHKYQLDGIDVDYEHFPASASPDTFARCIGQLVTTLKNKKVISFASIAPFDDTNVQSHYKALWSQYSHVIDYVNFQFYSYDKGTTEAQFLNYYSAQTANYHGGKVLASFSTESNAGGLTPAKGFFNACNKLKAEGSLAGIFVWSADSSHETKNGFAPEKKAQKLLAS